MQKKLSVMMPVYNMEKYLHTCFSALIKQKWDQQVEIIVIDDGSTDGSRDICEKYAAVYSYIKFIHKENGGVSSARNMALKYVSGEYFYWVDPDDYIADDFWEKVEPVLDKGYDFIFFDLVTFSDCYARKNHFADMSKNIERNTLVRLFCDGVKMASHLPTKILKKSLWEGIDFPVNISMCEDYYVFTHLVSRANNPFYLHENLYYYRQHANSITHNLSSYDLQVVYNLVKERYEHFLANGYDVDSVGIRYVEFYYLRNIILNQDLAEEHNAYKGLYKIMLKNLRMNYDMLLNSGYLNKKNKLVLYLILFNMKSSLRLISMLFERLKRIVKNATALFIMVD